MKTRIFLTAITFLIALLALAACGRALEPEEYEYESEYDMPYYEPYDEPDPIADTGRVAGAATAARGPFPSVHITSDLNPFTQERNYWHPGTVSITGVPDDQTLDNVPARLRGRGNSSWWSGPDKRPLRIRFGEARPVLGSDSVARDWVLLANHFDRSLLRNYAALNLGLMLDGLGFTPVPRHVHLYVNGRYMGVYLLTDERDVNPGRMQLVADDDPTVSDFFLEKDARAHQTGVLNETFIRIHGVQYDLRWPNDLPPEHVEYIKDYIGRVSYAIRRQSFDDILALIDLDSFVDFYIVQEFFKDVDSRDLSIFLYIQGTGEERRLFKGPVWDFDLAAGNAGHQPMGSGPEGLYTAVFNYWYRYLMRRPEFFEAVKNRWNEIRHEEIARTIELVRYSAVNYQEEFERNFRRHPGVFGRAQMPSPAIMLEIDNFMGHAEFLADWLETRANWLDAYFNEERYGDDHLWALVEYQGSTTPISLYNRHGQRHEFTVPAISIQNRVLVPLCELTAIFELEIDYEFAYTGRIAMLHAGVSVTHRAGDLYIEVDGVKMDFTMPTALSIREHIFVPIWVFAEALGYELSWDGLTRTVTVIGRG